MNFLQRLKIIGCSCVQILQILNALGRTADEVALLKLAGNDSNAPKSFDRDHRTVTAPGSCD